MTIRIRARGLLIDRDGVLNHAKDGRIIEGAVEWLSNLQKRNIPFLIATNHTTSSPAEAAEELRHAGFNVPDSVLHTPLSMLAGMFQTRMFKRVFARGTPELLRFIASFGLEIVESDTVDAVILGFDRSMDYQAVSTAISAIIDFQADFIALHENRIFRDSEHRVEPGLGAWVRAIEFASGKRACILGKPSPDYFREALAKLGLVAEDVVMISDDPLGDLQGAAGAGIRAIFTTSGKYRSISVLDQPEVRFRPDHIVESVIDVQIL